MNDLKNAVETIDQVIRERGIGFVAEILANACESEADEAATTSRTREWDAIRAELLRLANRARSFQPHVPRS